MRPSVPSMRVLAKSYDRKSRKQDPVMHDQTGDCRDTPAETLMAVLFSGIFAVNRRASNRAKLTSTARTNSCPSHSSTAATSLPAKV